VAKSRLRSIAGLILVVMLLGASVAGCGKPAEPAKPAEPSQPSQPAQPESKPIKLGVISSQTGFDAANGRYITEGMKMAIDDINAAGGLLGRKVQGIFEDDQGNQDVAVSALNKILSSNPDVDGLMLPVLSTEVLAMESIVKKAGVVGLYGGSNVKITTLGNEWIFRILPNDAVAGISAAKFAIEDLKAKKIGVIHSAEAFGTGGAEIIQKTCKELGIEPVAILSHNVEDKDFTAQLMTMKQKGVDTIIVWDLATPSGMICKQIKQLGIKANVVGSAAWVIPDVLKLAGDSAEGTYSIMDGVPVDDKHPDAKVAEFANRFKQRTGAFNNYGAAYYDAVMVWAEAVKKAGSTDRAKVRDALKSIKDMKLNAATYSFDAVGEGVHQSAAVKIEGGSPKLIKMVSAK